MRDPGVVDDDVDLPKSFNNSLETFADRTAVGHVERDPNNVFACGRFEFGDKLFQPFTAQIAGGNPASIFQQHLADAIADSTGRAGNQRHFISQRHVMIVHEILTLDTPCGSAGFFTIVRFLK